MYCNKCGNELVDGSKFCSKCGAKTETINNNKTIEKPKMQHHKIIIPITIGIIILFILISCIIMINKNKKMDEIKLLYDNTEKSEYENMQLQYNIKYVYEDAYISFFEDETYERNVNGIIKTNYTFNKETKEIICKEIQLVSGYEMDVEIHYEYINSNEIKHTMTKSLGIEPKNVTFGEIYSTNNALKEKEAKTEIQEFPKHNREQEDYILDNNSQSNISSNSNYSSSNNGSYSNNGYYNDNVSSNNNDYNSYSYSNDSNEEERNSEKEQLQMELDLKKQSRQYYLEESNRKIAQWDNDVKELKKELEMNENEENSESFYIQELKFQIANRQSIKEDIEKEQKETLARYDKEIAKLQEELDKLK